MTSRSSIFVLSVFAASIFSSNAGELKQSKDAGLLASSALNADPEFVDVGELIQNSITHKEIKIKNNSITGNIIISKIEASCHCLSPQLSRAILEPRESAVITFNIVAGNQKKTLNEVIAVKYQNDKINGLNVLSIPISGTVETVANVEPRRIEVTGSRESINKQLSISVKRGSSGLPWTRINATSKHFNGVLCDVVALSSDNFIINSTLKPEALIDGLNKFIIQFNCIDGDGRIAYSDFVTVQINLPPTISAFPSSIYLDDSNKEGQSKCTIRLKSAEKSININDVNITVSNPDVINIKEFKKVSDRQADCTVALASSVDRFLNEKIRFSFKEGYHSDVCVPVLGRLVVEHK